MLKLKEKYKKEAIPKMKEKFDYDNDLAVPQIERVVVNTGFGEMVSEKSSSEKEKIYEDILEDLAMICGQKPVIRTARKSISEFNLKKGDPIGAICTLRRKKMYDFLDRLIHIALPRSRDFQGIEQNSVDQSGNLTMGIGEHICFPEVSPEKAERIFGLEITVVTTTENREEGLELFKLLGFPLKSNQG